jgi:hypothetical protein
VDEILALLLLRKYNDLRVKQSDAKVLDISKSEAITASTVA